MARVATDFVADNSPYEGSEWTLSPHRPDANIEDVSPPERVFSRRVFAAWSVDDRDTVDALLRSACSDPVQRRLLLRDLFEFAVDRAEELAEHTDNLQAIVWQLIRSIRGEGLAKA